MPVWTFARLCLIWAIIAVVGGCAQLGWPKGERRFTLSDEEPAANETETEEPSPEPLEQPARLAGPSDDSTAAERDELVRDTLARMKTLPDVTPAQYAETERALRQSRQELPLLYLKQFNGLVRFRQEELRKAAAPAPKPAPVAAAPVTPAPVTAAVTAPPPSPAREAPAAAANPAVAPPTPVVTTAETKTDSPSGPQSLAARLRQAKAAKAAAPAGIFGGKVDTGKEASADAAAVEAPAEKPAESAATHTTRKPADSAPALTPAETKAAASDDRSWREQLAGAIASLESDLQKALATSPERGRQEAQLRLLYLLGERSDAALKPIEGVDATEQQYWTSQLKSLEVSLAAEGTPVKGRRATLALRPLREAVDHLAGEATLDVRHVALCSAVAVWGSYTEFPKYEFKPNQEVLLYFEVENFASEPTPQGFATEFISSYEIFDPAGRRVAEQQFPVAQETCRHRRRDYFVRYHLHIPKQLAAGDYTLQLTVEDQKGHKFGQGSVKFKVVASG